MNIHFEANVRLLGGSASAERSKNILQGRRSRLSTWLLLWIWGWIRRLNILLVWICVLSLRLGWWSWGLSLSLWLRCLLLAHGSDD